MLAIFTSLLLLIGNTLGANILALMAVPSHSHHLFYATYVEALAARGHHVTYVGPDEYNPPENITHVFLEGSYDGLDEDFSTYSHLGPYGTILLLYQWEQQIAFHQSRSKGIAQLRDILKKEKFDLIVNDIACGLFLFGAVDAAGQPPMLGLTAFGIPTWAFDLLGNPRSHAGHPNFYSLYTNEMNLLERLNNYFLNLFSSAVFWYQLRGENEYSKAAFGNVRPLEEILNDLNMIIVNSNEAINYPFPKVPGLLQVAGIQIVKPKPLPEDLQTYLDNAKHGVIYFSLGSNMKSSRLKAEKTRVFVEAFKQMAPVQILWKWEADSFPGKPSNVKTRKWLPQNDILAHPNVRLFVTHSGGLSSQEAIYHGKPVIGIPLYLDQHVNARKAVNKGFGEKLDIDSLSVEVVVRTIKKVLNDPRYTENARELSAIFRDDLNTPLEQATYWTEYAIRHKGAPHLRFAGRNLYWYQNWMLDVILILLAGMFCVLFVCYKLIMLILGIGRKVKRTKTKRS